MTTEQLLKLDIYFVGSKLYPRKYFVPQVGEIKIPESWTILDIFELLYEKGRSIGIEEGKELKIKELKRCLNILSDNE